MLDIDLSGPQPVIRLKSDITIATSRGIKSSLAEYLDEAGHDLYIDMSQVNYVDSSGLSLLLSMTRKLSHGGNRLVLMGTREEVLVVFKLAEVATMFHFEDKIG
jgi:anti-sigma B factor antagonist